MALSCQAVLLIKAFNFKQSLIKDSQTRGKPVSRCASLCRWCAARENQKRLNYQNDQQSQAGGEIAHSDGRRSLQNSNTAWHVKHEKRCFRKMAFKVSSSKMLCAFLLTSIHMRELGRFLICIGNSTLHSTNSEFELWN